MDRRDRLTQPAILVYDIGTTLEVVFTNLDPIVHAFQIGRMPRHTGVIVDCDDKAGAYVVAVPGAGYGNARERTGFIVPAQNISNDDGRLQLITNRPRWIVRAIGAVRYGAKRREMDHVGS